MFIYFQMPFNLNRATNIRSALNPDNNAVGSGKSKQN